MTYAVQFRQAAELMRQRLVFVSDKIDASSLDYVPGIEDQLPIDRFLIDFMTRERAPRYQNYPEGHPRVFQSSNVFYDMYVRIELAFSRPILFAGENSAGQVRRLESEIADLRKLSKGARVYDPMWRTRTMLLFKGPISTVSSSTLLTELMSLEAAADELDQHVNALIETMSSRVELMKAPSGGKPIDWQMTAFLKELAKFWFDRTGRAASKSSISPFKEFVEAVWISGMSENLPNFERHLKKL